MTLKNILEKIQQTPVVHSQKVASFDQRWCTNAAKIRGLPFEILAKRQHNLAQEVML